MDLQETRILHLTNVMDIGGVQKIIYEICSGTQKAFEKIVVASSGGEYADKVEKLGIQHVLIPDLSLKNIREIHRLKRILIQVVKQNDINLIHCHHRMAVFYAKLWFKGVPIIYNNHTIYSDKKWMSHFVLRNIKLVADGIQSKKNLTDFFGLDEKRITVINNAVDKYKGNFVDIEEIAEEKRKGQFIVMNCSRLHPQKAVNYFIEAASILRDQGLHIKFFIVGDGEEKKALEKLVSDLDIEDCVSFLGFRNDIKNTIWNCDLLVQTSIYEGLPLTPMEAFSVKRAVVGTDIEGTREVIHNGINGLLAENRNAKSIAEMIEKVYYDRHLLEQLSNQAYESFLNEFCADVMVNHYLDFYRGL